MTIELQYKVQDLNARYVDAIDDDRLESWPEFFVEKCLYRVTTAENEAQGLPMGFIYATSKPMLRDRIKALRQANVYEAQRYRHVLSAPVILGDEQGVVRVRTGFIAARIMHTGETMLFATGRYEDRVTFENGQGLFVEKSVVIDSRQIDTLLAIPL